MAARTTQAGELDTAITTLFQKLDAYTADALRGLPGESSDQSPEKYAYTILYHKLMERPRFEVLLNSRWTPRPVQRQTAKTVVAIDPHA